MKKLAIITLLLFLLIAAIIGFIESPWGKRVALQLLTQSLNQSGLTIEVGAIEGSLPQKITLLHLDIRGDGWKVKGERLEIELSLIRLFNKELFIKNLEGEGITWSYEEQKTPSKLQKGKKKFSYALSIRHLDLRRVAMPGGFDGDLKGSLKMQRSGKVRLSLEVKGAETPLGPFQTEITLLGPLSGPLHGEIKGRIETINWEGAFTWNSGWSSKFQGEIEGIPGTAPLRVEMDLASGEEKRVKLQILYETAQSIFGSFPVRKVSGKWEATWREKSLEGIGNVQGEIYQQLWEGKTDFIWSEGSPFELNGFTLHGPTLSASGDFSITPGGLISGKNELHIERLQALQFPFLPLFGSLDAQFVWEGVEGKQTLHSEIGSKQIFWGSLFGEELFLTSDLSDLFGSPQGNLNIDLKGGKWKQLEIASVHLQSSRQETNWPFQLSVRGKWKHPIEVTLNGFWQSSLETWELEIEDGSGSFYNHPFLLTHSLRAEKTGHSFQLTPLEIRLGDGIISGALSHIDDQTEGQLAIRHFPVDMLSLNPLDLSIGGTFDLETHWTQKGKDLQANLNASVADLEVATLQETDPFLASGHLEATYQNDRLEAVGSLVGNNAPLMELQLSLPLHSEIWPLCFEPLDQRDMKGKIDFQGKVEDLFDFFDLGTHHFQGDAQCHFNISHTLAEPRLTGSCSWKNGAYQNYYTGTQLKNIQAEWIASGDKLTLRSLDAEDYQSKGNFSAQGNISLDAEHLFPFTFQLSFSRLNCVEIDLVSAEATGEVNLIGNLKEATATGNIAILQSVALIPDHIPRPLPKLQVVYRNPTQPLPHLLEIPPPPYPLHLDLHVSAPEGVFITGRGLTSEWKGEFVLSGTITSPAAKGKLELITGDFLFASRRFKLSEGALSLSGKEHEMPHLNLAATLEQNGVSIIARLRGALNQPQLTFQSVPPLPMSSIVAYLLFGEDLSEINGLQALQLANSIAAIVGDGPEVLENTRRSLGVDRLRVITVPSGAEEGEDAIALQVGKYVAQGVIISVSQGAEDNSSNISIEVELKYGFAFQAETQQQQEQGKFTIKWNLNY